VTEIVITTTIAKAILDAGKEILEEVFNQTAGVAEVEPPTTAMIHTSTGAKTKYLDLKWL